MLKSNKNSAGIAQAVRNSEENVSFSKLVFSNANNLLNQQHEKSKGSGSRNHELRAPTDMGCVSGTMPPNGTMQNTELTTNSLSSSIKKAQVQSNSDYYTMAAGEPKFKITLQPAQKPNLQESRGRKIVTHGYHAGDQKTTTSKASPIQMHSNKTITAPAITPRNENVGSQSGRHTFVKTASKNDQVQILDLT